MSTSIEDNELPKAILTRIMKQALPENTNIQANAKLAMTKSTTLFINYLASAANDVAASAGHKIVSGAHVLKALESVDLEEMLPRLTEELQAFQSIQRSRKEGAAKAAKDKDGSSSAVAGSKKRKPTSDDSGTVAKSRKSSISANPRDGQETPSDMLTDGEDKEDDDEQDEDEDEDEEEEEGDDAGADEASAEKSLNMNDPEQEDKQVDADEDDDSDGF